jgi:hypothetical protein
MPDGRAIPTRVRLWLLWYRVARDGNTDRRTSASWAWQKAKEGKAPYA